MVPLVGLRVYFQLLDTPGVLGDDNLRAALIHVFDDPARIKRFVRDQAAELDVLDEWGNTNRIVSLSRRQNKTHQIAQGIDRAMILVVNPPLPCLWLGFESLFCVLAVAVDLDNGAVDHRELYVRFIRQGVEYLLENIGFDPIAKAQTVVHLPRPSGKSRYGLAVRAIHRTASKNNRPSPPVQPGSVFLPRQYGSIKDH